MYMCVCLELFVVETSNNRFRSSWLSHLRFLADDTKEPTNAQFLRSRT